MATYTSHRFLFLPFIVLLSAVSFTAARRIVRTSTKAGISGAQTSFPYLYATKNDLNASYPVIEYIAPTAAKQLENDRPSFLYDPNQGYRIVVFVSLLRFIETNPFYDYLLTYHAFFLVTVLLLSSMVTGAIHARISSHISLILFNEYNKLRRNRAKELVYMQYLAIQTESYVGDKRLRVIQLFVCSNLTKLKELMYYTQM
jgi:hypothetical protein